MKVTLYIKPCAKARPRVTTRGTYMPKAYMDWRLRFRQLWHNCVPSFTAFSKNIHVTATWYTKMGKMRPDVDNVVAAVLDALQDVRAITNDRYVTSVACTVVASGKPDPYVVIEITEGDSQAPDQNQQSACTPPVP